jgi:hypothetical protein
VPPVPPVPPVGPDGPDGPDGPEGPVAPTKLIKFDKVPPSPKYCFAKTVSRFDVDATLRVIVLAVDKFETPYTFNVLVPYTTAESTVK